jgi:5-hydroxyisourate hydrolase
MPGKLSTHALDIHHGRPAEGLVIQLFRLDGKGARVPLKIVTTNPDGRTDAPLLGPEEIGMGTYELVFGIGAYFVRGRVPLSDPPFLDEVPVRFAVADVSLTYHIPLLFSPWAYSTYRGS